VADGVWTPPSPGGGTPGGHPHNGHTASAGAAVAVRGPERSSVDYTAVRALRQQVSKELTAALRDLTNVTAERRHAEGERIAARLVREHVDALMAAGQPITADAEAALLDAVAADLFGLGRLQVLLDRPDIINIHILGCDQVRIELADGQITYGAPIADTDEDMVQMFQVLAMRAGATERSLSSTKPWLDMQLPDAELAGTGSAGSRLTVVYEVAERPLAAIRRHTLVDVTLEDLRDRFGAIDALVCDFLKAAMATGCNIMIAGLADAGKTTMLRALASEIPPAEPFVVLEESRELGLHTTGRHPWAMSLEARQGHGALGPDGRPAGSVTTADLIPLTLRMSVQRIIVGEVRSREIVPMLQAMSTSKGSMCTIHARNPRSVMDRIIELALQYGPEMKADLARRMAAGAIDLILFLTVEDETKIGGRKLRYVSEIVEIGGMSGDQLVTTTVFGPGLDGRAVPRHQPERLADVFRRVGYDARLLTSYAQQGDANAGAWTHPLPTVDRRP
jgi:pilus assembly protein CpaF